MIRRGAFEGERPSLEKNGLKYIFDYDFILTNDGDSITKDGDGYIFRSRHSHRAGSFTSMMQEFNAVLGPEGAIHQDVDTDQAQIFGVYKLDNS